MALLSGKIVALPLILNDHEAIFYQSTLSDRLHTITCLEPALGRESAEQDAVGPADFSGKHLGTY